MGGVFSMKGEKIKYGTFRFIGKVLKISCQVDLCF
jgi:hypothetical protein